ncbi:MAG: sigma-70 family RNA polymerase sigma factor [Gemmatimonadota bacterium]
MALSRARTPVDRASMSRTPSRRRAVKDRQRGSKPHESGGSTARPKGGRRRLPEAEFAAIVAEAQPRMLRHANRMMGGAKVERCVQPEDVVQWVFLKAARGKLPLQGIPREHQIRVLLKAVRWRISNLWRDQTRRRERLQEHPPKFLVPTQPDQSAASREVLEKADAALSGLAPRQEEVARKYYFEEATAPEIAEDLDIAVATVRETLRKGRGPLKDGMKVDHEDLE